MSQGSTGEQLLDDARKANPGTLWQYWRNAGWTLPVVLGHVGIGTLVWYRLLSPQGTSVEDSFYFAVVSFLTIGYGDISPASPGGKVFFIVYVIVSLVVQLTVVTTLVSSALTFHKDVPLNVFLERRQGGGRARTAARERHNPMQALSFFVSVKARLFQITCAFGILVALVMIGAGMLHMQENTPWLDAIYWAVTTLTTVGYGDITPDSTRAYFAVYFLIGVSVFTYVLGEAVALFVESMRVRKLSKFFARGLTKEAIEKMDVYSDGQVSEAEFMIFMLQELDIAKQSELSQIMTLFDILDRTGDGVINMDDVRASSFFRSTASTSRNLASGVDQGRMSAAADSALAAVQEESERQRGEAELPNDLSRKL